MAQAGSSQRRDLEELGAARPEQGDEVGYFDVIRAAVRGLLKSSVERQPASAGGWIAVPHSNSGEDREPE